ncbi:hypothetical protein OEZ85_007154 [Tetradesmus obliquus]|uniref:Uncharacterized protein n=1 Tax=Tetradesmus obliquus TaxID=3088 RepID=A0ABY8TX68_TETOB|nr:hypothetical protein OEZ85_007154 [Tetradesmus obliquus]
MARSHVITALVLIAFAAVVTANVEDDHTRKLLQGNARSTGAMMSQQSTSAAIKTTVQNAQAGRGSTGNTKAATRTGSVATTVLARPSGPNTATAGAVTRAATPANRPTGRHLLQARNTGAAGSRATASQATTSAAIKQTVQAANRGAPVAAKPATRTGQTAAQVIARPAGLPATVTSQAVTTRPAQQRTGRHLLQNSRTGANQGRATASQATTSAAIKQTVQAANRGAPVAAKPATRTGQTAAQVIARPAGLPATVTSQAVTTRPAQQRTGRHLLQNSRTGANQGRATASQATTSAAIKQTVQAANRGAPVAAKPATRTGQAAAQTIARPAGLPATVTSQAMTTRPAQQNPRGL